MARPSIQTIKTRLLGNIRAGLGLIASVRRTLVGVFSDAIAGQLYLAYTYSDNQFAESHPLDATGERLDQWGQMIQLPRAFATFAQINITGAGTAGSVVPMGSELRTSDNKLYTTMDDATVDAMGVFMVTVIARNLGANQNLAQGETLNFTTALSGVENRVEVSELAVSGTDSENDIEYRERIVQFFRRATWRAGGIDDYIAVALADQNVRYAWVAKEYNGIANQVGVFCLKENNQLLTNEELNEVNDSLRRAAPVTARPFALSPTIEDVPFTISMRENNAAVQAEVRNNLNDLFARSRAPKGTVNSDGSANTGIVYISQVREAISLATGEEDNIVEMPTANIAPMAQYGILSLGEITFKDLVS